MDMPSFHSFQYLQDVPANQFQNQGSFHADVKTDSEADWNMDANFYRTANVSGTELSYSPWDMKPEPNNIQRYLREQDRPMFATTPQPSKTYQLDFQLNNQLLVQQSLPYPTHNPFPPSPSDPFQTYEELSQQESSTGSVLSDNDGTFDQRRYSDPYSPATSPESLPPAWTQVTAPLGQQFEPRLNCYSIEPKSTLYEWKDADEADFDDANQNLSLYAMTEAMEVQFSNHSHSEMSHSQTASTSQRDETRDTTIDDDEDLGTIYVKEEDEISNYSDSNRKTRNPRRTTRTRTLVDYADIPAPTARRSSGPRTHASKVTKRQGGAQNKCNAHKITFKNNSEYR
jgi:hypothetical protein